MIGIDTNVLVRHLVRDDPVQAAGAAAAFDRMTVENPGYLPTVVLTETYRVLRNTYGFDANDALAALDAVSGAENVVVQEPAQTSWAIRAARAGADFADALIAAACVERGCTSVLSFDGRAQTALGFVAPA